MTVINNRYDWLELNPEICSCIVLMYRMKIMLQEPSYKFEDGVVLRLLLWIFYVLVKKWGKSALTSQSKGCFGFIECMRTAMVLDWLKDNTRVNLRQIGTIRSFQQTMKKSE